NREGKKIAVVAFNVKERDLLYLEKHSGEQLPEAIEEWGTASDQRIAKICRDYGVSLEFDSKSLKYFAPGRAYQPDTPHSLRTDGRVTPFYWSLASVKRKGGTIRLPHLLDPDDVDERAIGVLSTIEDLLAASWDDEEHFQGLINRLPS